MLSALRKRFVGLFSSHREQGIVSMRPDRPIQHEQPATVSKFQSGVTKGRIVKKHYTSGRKLRKKKIIAMAVKQSEDDNKDCLAIKKETDDDVMKMEGSSDGPPFEDGNRQDEVRQSVESIPESQAEDEAFNEMKAVCKEDSENLQTLPRNYPGWTRAEIYMFNKLAMRGFEVLLPRSWQLDFGTIPHNMFASNNEVTGINSLCGNDFRGMKALRSMIMLGTRVRDRLLARLRPEPTLRREIASYIKWSQGDASLRDRDFIPMLAVCTARKGEVLKSVIERMTVKLHELGYQYRKAWYVEDESEEYHDNSSGSTAHLPVQKSRYKYPLPTVFGLLIMSTIVALVSYDSAAPENPGGNQNSIKTLSYFDFADDTQDVWNGFGVAIVCCRVRDFLYDHLSEWEVVIWPVDDPDA